MLASHRYRVANAVAAGTPTAEETMSRHSASPSFKEYL